MVKNVRCAKEVGCTHFVVGLRDGSEAVGGGGGPLRANSSR